MTHSNPFEAIHSELNELKGMVKQILTAPKEDYSLKIYTVQEAAKILGCNHQTVTNNIKKGNIHLKNGMKLQLKHVTLLQELFPEIWERTEVQNTIAKFKI